MLTKTIPASKAKERFAEHLRRAASGETVVITRYGKPVAALVSTEDLERLEETRGKRGGLAQFAGAWDDGDELADDVVRSVRRRRPVRPLPPLDS